MDHLADPNDYRYDLRFGCLVQIYNNMKALKFLWTYLKDWKNWLTHSIIGVMILLVAFYLPVAPIYRILILAVVVTFNVFRMRLEKAKKSKNKN